MAVSLVALMATGSAAKAQDVFDWSGFYVGATAGATSTNSDAGIVYTDGEYAGWSDGYFTGEAYDEVDSAEIDFYGDSEEGYELSLGSLEDWVTETETGELTWSGTAVAGAQSQFGAFVLGGELRASVGSFETSYAYDYMSYTGDNGSITCPNDDDEDPEETCLVDVNGGWAVDVDGVSISEGDSAYLWGGVDQDGRLVFSANIDQTFAAVARAGIAADRFLIYGLAGASVAEITSTTAANVEETGALEAEAGGSDDAEILGDYYSWYGESSESKVGLLVGAGVEYAVTDNVILRGEVSFANYGDVSVTGYSMDTDATYTVTQSITQTKAEAGLLFKF